MKKIEVFYYICDTIIDGYYPSSIVEQWKKSEEYAFLEKHSYRPIECIRRDNNYTLETRVSCYAILDDQDETYWRLKFK